MDYKKSMVIIICLLAFAIKVQTSREFQRRLNNSMLKIISSQIFFPFFKVINDIEYIERPIRSFGCDGPNHRNEYRCRLHCRSEGYRTGFCSAFTKFKDCVCSRSPISRSKNINFFPVILNISRL